MPTSLQYADGAIPLLEAGPVVEDADGLPFWWRELKQKGWEDFQCLPEPKRKDETWRFGNITALKQVESSRVGAPVFGADAAELLERSALPFATTSAAVFANDTALKTPALPADLAAKGVIFETLEEAVRLHGDLIREHFMAEDMVLGSAKYAALHRAFCRAGVFLFVPKNVEIELPLSAHHWLHGAGSAVFPHTLIVAGANSKVTFLDYFASSDRTPGFACGVKDMILGPGAEINYLACQEWSEQTLAFHLNSVSADRDSRGKYLVAGLGGRCVRGESHSRLNGPGSRSDMLGLAVLHGRQEWDQRTLQDHNAPNCVSDLLYKNTLDHRSRSIFSGLIRVAPGSSLTDAYQTNRNLLLNPDAEADSMPGLEILNDDVKCSHGATTGQIDAEELFYMQARGIEANTARRLIAVGFYQEVLDRFGHQDIAADLRNRIQAKFEKAREDDATEQAEAAAEEEVNVRRLQGTL